MEEDGGWVGGMAGFCGHIRSLFGIPSVVGVPTGSLLESDMF